MEQRETSGHSTKHLLRAESTQSTMQPPPIPPASMAAARCSSIGTSTFFRSVDWVSDLGNFKFSSVDSVAEFLQKQGYKSIDEADQAVAQCNDTIAVATWATFKSTGSPGFKSGDWVDQYADSHVDVEDPSSIFDGENKRQASSAVMDKYKAFYNQSLESARRLDQTQESAEDSASEDEDEQEKPRTVTSTIIKKRTEREAPPKTQTKKRRAKKDFIKKYFVPTDADVLMGRGGRTNHHPGNKRYLEEKAKIQERYLAATKNDKTAISQELVDRMHDLGARFLELEKLTDQWYQVDEVRARKKCSQTLRELNTPEERATKRQKYGKYA